MAQYGIIRMQKFKKDAVTGIQKHNQREGKESKNQDIDKEKTDLNYDLVNQENISYAKTIGAMTDERVSRKVRADAVLVSEFFVSASPEYMESLTEQEQEKYFETAFNHLEEKYGEQNILYATVHKDEATPHLHLGIVPITEDGRLSAKDYFHGKQKIRAIQDDFHEYMNENGFEIERGESSERKHKDVHQYKAEQRAAEIKKLDEQMKAKAEHLNYLRELEASKQSTVEQKADFFPSVSVDKLQATSVGFGKMVIERNELEEFKDYTRDLQLRLTDQLKTNGELSDLLHKKDQELSITKNQLKKANGVVINYAKEQDLLVDKAKEAMRNKVKHEFTEEKRAELKEEIHVEYKGEISKLEGRLREKEGLLAESKKQLTNLADSANEQLNKAREYLNSSVPKEKYNRALEMMHNLQKDNKELQGWKDRMIHWAKNSLKRFPELAESFFRTGGMEKEASKYQEDELER